MAEKDMTNGPDRPTGDTLLSATLEQARAEQPSRVRGFKESMRDRWAAAGHDPADFDERWKQFCEEAKADPTLGGQFPFMAEAPAPAEFAGEPHPVERLIKDVVNAEVL